MVTLGGVEWLAHQLLRELASESVDIGELIVAAKAMPEWDKAVEVEENESWEALKEVDKQDKLEAEKRRKNENKNKNKNKNKVVKNPHKKHLEPENDVHKEKKRKKLKEPAVAPGQRTLDGFGFRVKPVSKPENRQKDLELVCEGQDVELLQAQFEEYLNTFEKKYETSQCAEPGVTSFYRHGRNNIVGKNICQDDILMLKYEVCF